MALGHHVASCKDVVPTNVVILSCAPIFVKNKFLFGPIVVVDAINNWLLKGNSRIQEISKKIEQ